MRSAASKLRQAQFWARCFWVFSGRFGICLCSFTQGGLRRRCGFLFLVQAGASIILSYGTNLSRFSIIPAIVMHAMFNTVSDFLNGMFVHTRPRTSIRFELVMALCGIATAAALIFATKSKLAFRSNSLIVHDQE